jgi:hypothetical protein
VGSTATMNAVNSKWKRLAYACVALCALAHFTHVVSATEGSAPTVHHPPVDEATGCMTAPEDDFQVRTTRWRTYQSVNPTGKRRATASEKARLAADAAVNDQAYRDSNKSAEQKAAIAEAEAKVKVVVDDFLAQYEVDRAIDWDGRGKISDGVYGEILYMSDHNLDPKLHELLVKKCKTAFPKTVAGTSHTVTIYDTYCEIVFAATPVKKVSKKQSRKTRSPIATVLTTAFAPSPQDEAGPSNRQHVPAQESEQESETESEDTASDMEHNDYEALCIATRVAEAEAIGAAAKAAYLADTKKRVESSEDIDKATLKVAKKFTRDRLRVFQGSVYNKWYQDLRQSLSGTGLKNIQTEIKKWTEAGRTAPTYAENFMDIVLEVRKSLVKDTPEWKEVDNCLKRCKLHYGNLYCGDPTCGNQATCVSIRDYVAYREDRECKTAVMYGCFSCADAKAMFLGYCYRKQHLLRPRSPIAYCAQHVPDKQPSISFQDQENRTCMCCKSKDSAGNHKGDGTEAVYTYYTCTDCASLEASTSDTERKGIMEKFYVEGLQLYAHIAAALLPLASEIVISPQRVHDKNKIDISITHKHPSGVTIIDLFELNGAGHVMNSDLDKAVRIVQKADKGTRYRIWLVRTYKNDLPLMEVCRQHWLRQHVLTEGCDGNHIPLVQVFLVGGTPDNKKKLHRYFHENMQCAKTFLGKNVHILTGVPAPIYREVGSKAAFACRDHVKDCRKIIGEFAPFQIIWDWSTMDQQYGATRQGVYKPSNGHYMQKPACTPLKLRKNMMELPETIDFGSMDLTPQFKNKC